MQTLTPAPPEELGRRRARILLVIVLAVAVVGGATLAAALAGVFDDKGRFSAEPPACATVEASAATLGPGYQLTQDAGNNCVLRGPSTVTVSYVVVEPSRGDAPAAASNKLKELSPLGLKALPSVGDEAYRWEDRIYFRVSNLLVSVTAAPSPEVIAFAADVAKRLAS